MAITPVGAGGSQAALLADRAIDGGALEGNPPDFKAKPVATELFWMGERDGYGAPDPTSRKAHRLPLPHPRTSPP